MSSSTQGGETGGAVRLFSAQPAASRLDMFFFSFGADSALAMERPLRAGTQLQGEQNTSERKYITGGALLLC